MIQNHHSVITPTVANEIKNATANNIEQDLLNKFTGKMADYTVGKEIGKGAYAVVKQCIHKPTGLKLAIKIYEKYKLLDSVRKAAVKREIDVLKQLAHKNVLKLYEVIEGIKQVTYIFCDHRCGSLLNSYKESLYFLMLNPFQKR
jgi:serine/threonine protein kinase